MSIRAGLAAAVAVLLTTAAGGLFAAGPDLSVAPAVRSHAEVLKSGNSAFEINVSGLTPPVNRSIEITGPAEDVRLKLEGGLDFSSIQALASSLVRPGMTDEEKVKAVFYFAIRHLYDRGSAGCDDPLEYINLYGFSYCGNYALLLNALWSALGFPTVYLNPVIRQPSGHGITSVYYDNQWHMYDSRLRGYFLNRDNRTVASLVDLDLDDSLIRRGLDYESHLMGHWDYFLTLVNYFNAESDWYDGFNAHFENQKLFNRNCPPWDGRLDLREGEKLTLCWDNRGKWWSRKDLSPRWLEVHPSEGREAMTIPPIIYANGTLEFQVDPRLSGRQAFQAEGLRIAGKGAPVFQPAMPNKTGFVTYKVRAPYFVPSMRVQASGLRKTERDSLKIELSTDEGASWSTLWEARNTGTLSVDVTTEETQRVTWYSPNKYSCLLRFSLKAADTPAAVSLGDIRITADLFYRPLILPALKNGANRLTWQDRSPGGHPRKVTFNWLEDTNILLSDDSPAVGDSVTLTALVRNSGDSPAENVAVRFFDGDPAGGGVRIGPECVIDRIEPGQSGRAVTVWVPEQRQIGASSGFSIAHGQMLPGYTHNTIFVQVDPENRLAESDEGNNTTCREVTVNNMANLVLSDPSFVSFDRRGDKVRVTALVRNQNLYGLLPRAREARNVAVRFYDGQANRYNLDERLIGEAVIPAIAPGEFGAARVEWDVSGLAGRHRVYVVVDPFDRIPEKWQHDRGIYMQLKKDIEL